MYRKDNVSVFEVDGRKNKVRAKRMLSARHFVVKDACAELIADILPEPVPPREDVPRPQDALLRR